MSNVWNAFWHLWELIIPLEVLEQYGFIFELANVVLILVLIFLPILYMLKKI